ncbi:metallophosphoesterase family protein [Pelagibacterium sp.]|uniref:metallophosphoesterase family protein n=1 Tax=Pelagibacterium sp. TaxID=1967288 RepID=UPI003A8FB391
MRVAVISDVHANALALEAVLADIERHDVEKILNLGDHFAGPLWPKQTAALLAQREMVAIRGNTDRYLLEGDVAHADASDLKILAEIDGEPLRWLKSLPETAVYSDTIFMSHGSPRSDETYWLDRKVKKQGFRVASIDEVEAELPNADYPVYCCGHTHIARVVPLADGRIVFNPGSVGRPSFNMSDTDSAMRLSPAASYAIVERSAGKWHVNLRQVAYDNMAASAMARAWGEQEWSQDLAKGRRR